MSDRDKQGRFSKRLAGRFSMAETYLVLIVATILTVFTVYRNWTRLPPPAPCDCSAQIAEALAEGKAYSQGRIEVLEGDLEATAFRIANQQHDLKDAYAELDKLKKKHPDHSRDNAATRRLR